MKRSKNSKVSSNKKIRWIFLMGVFLIFQMGCTSKPQSTPIIENGIIDLSGWDFSQYPEISLQGQSLFYWKQWPIDENGSFDLSNLVQSDTIALPPALWSSAGYESKGYGTFRFSIHKGTSDETLILNMDRVLGALEIWINGKKLKKFGSLSKNGDSEVLNGRPLRFELPKEKTLDVMLLVSNHNNRLGGGFPLQNRIQIASYFERQYPSKPIIEGFITLIIVLFGVHEIYKFYSFNKYDYFLYFGLYCLIGASRQFFVGETIIYYFFPDLSFDIVQKMRYIGYFGGLSVIVLYHYALFPYYVSKLFVKWMYIIPLIGVIYILLAPIYYGTLAAPFFQLYGLFLVIIGVYLLLKAIKDKKPYAAWVLLILVITASTFINDILNAMLIIQTAYIVNYGVLFYVIFQAYLNHKVQINKEQLLRTLSIDIEQLQLDVDDKQEEIKKLRTETFQHFKSKERLVDNLKKVASNDTTISLQNLIANLRSELIEDSQLSLIKNDIETLNYEFIQRIKRIHPRLTKTDLEICTYLRMSLGRKEIARLRFTSLDAVKKSRNRLRKKMELPPEENLGEYIRSI
ncbi:7TM diverse intracellular signaling domain-containing protein [Aquimarina sp. 2304DJ70-9]|uniref:7TM diverse intracellular signaling domain-containing protein n=1 Tax=Aquimarina penaris TaxID=3231044 RepID=UPI003462C7BF